jgi:Tfp pilus assembly protein PilV
MLKEQAGILIEALISSTFLAVALIGMTSVLSKISNELNAAIRNLQSESKAQPSPINANCFPYHGDPSNKRLICQNQNGLNLIFYQ